MDLLITIVVTVICYILALFVIVKNYKSATNILFALLISFLGLYPVFNYLSLHAQSNEQALYWATFILLVAIPSGPLFFAFVKIFPSSKFQLQKFIFIPISIWALFNIILALKGYIFTSVNIVDGSPIIHPGPGVISFGLLQVLCIIGGSITLIQKYRHSRGRLRLQLQYITYGIILSFMLAGLGTLLLPLFFGITLFIPLSPLFFLIAPVTIAYSIFRHQLLDIRFVVVRTVTYIVLVLVIAVLYSLIVLLFSRQFTGITLTTNQLTLFIFLTIGVVFSFQIIRKNIENITNRIFFRKSYNTEDVVQEISHLVTSTILLDELTDRVLTSLKKHLFFQKGFFLFLSADHTHEYKSIDISPALNFSQKFIQCIQAVHSMIIFDDLEEGELKERMRSENISVVIPLMTQGKEVAMMLLGSKESGDLYTEQDRELMNIISSHVAVAIQNAQAIEEIKKFNVTLQKEVENATKELREANRQLQDLDKLKDEFVSLASHELRTPMSAIKGSLSTILEGYAGDISSETREFLSAAYNENDRLIRLVNNLLNTSRIESGRLSFTLSNVDMTALIQEVVKNMQIAVKEKNIFLRHESSGALPLVTADEDKIKEVLINLIGNATKFTSQGGITVKTEVIDGMVQTLVTDTGTGIHKEDFDLLFKKFSQVKRDQKYTKSYGGTGLGLYLSQKIIEGLGGKIWLDSEVGKGTVFYFTLPIAK